MLSARRERKVRAHRDIGTPTKHIQREGEGGRARAHHQNGHATVAVGRIATHRGNPAYALFYEKYS